MMNEKLEMMEVDLIVYGKVAVDTVEVAKALNGVNEKTYLTILKVCLDYDNFEEFREDYKGF